MKEKMPWLAHLIAVLGSLIFSVTFFVQEIKYPGEDATVPPLYLYLVLISLATVLAGWVISAVFGNKDNTSDRAYIPEAVLAAMGAVLLVAFSFDDKYILVSLLGFDLLVSSVFIGMTTVIARSKDRKKKGLKEYITAAFPYYLHDRVDELLTYIRQIKPLSGRENLFCDGFMLDENGELTEKKMYAVLNDGALALIPKRLNIGYDGSLFSNDEVLRKMYLCLLSRSYDGHIRETAVRELGEKDISLFIMPYILEAASDYAVQVQEALYEGLKDKENTELKIFCKNNLELFIKGYSRMQCYHYEYYREHAPIKRDFIGFKLFYECMGFKKGYIGLNLRAEGERWNRMWQMYAEGTLDSEAQALCEYSAAVNGEGHAGFFDNNKEHLEEHMRVLRKILPDDMYKGLSLAYESIGSEEETESCDAADTYFFEHEYEISFLLRDIAHRIDISEKQRASADKEKQSRDQ